MYTHINVYIDLVEESVQPPFLDQCSKGFVSRRALLNYPPAIVML